MLYGVAAGIFYCAASFLTYVALQIGSFALSMLILSYSVVCNIGYGLMVLREEAGVFTYIGLALIFASLYLTRADGKKDADRRVTWKWLACIGVAAIGNGLFGVIQRMQQIRFENACNNEFMVVALSFASVVLLSIGLVKNREDLPFVLKKGIPWTAAAGASNGITNALIVLLHTLMPISISSPIRIGLKIIFSFALSVLIFKEKFEKRQLLGVLLGTLALVLLNL